MLHKFRQEYRKVSLSNTWQEPGNAAEDGVNFDIRTVNGHIDMQREPSEGPRTQVPRTATSRSLGLKSHLGNDRRKCHQQQGELGSGCSSEAK